MASCYMTAAAVWAACWVQVVYPAVLVAHDAHKCKIGTDTAAYGSGGSTPLAGGPSSLTRADTIALVT